MAAFEIKRNDRRPRYRLQLTANATPVDLTGASAVRFTMTPASGTAKISRQPMTIIDAATGIVEYTWTALDTDTAGDFNAEVEVDWGSGQYQTFPTKGFFMVTINPDLA